MIEKKTFDVTVKIPGRWDGGKQAPEREVTARVEIEVNWHWLALDVGRQAVRNKTGKSTALAKAIVARVVKR